MGQCTRVCPVQLDVHNEFDEMGQLRNVDCIKCGSCAWYCAQQILEFRAPNVNEHPNPRSSPNVPAPAKQDPDRSCAFLCGTSTMVKKSVAALQDASMLRENIIVENFAKQHSRKELAKMPPTGSLSKIGCAISSSTTPTDGGAEGATLSLYSRLRGNSLLQAPDSRIMRLIGKRSVLRAHNGAQAEVVRSKAKPYRCMAAVVSSDKEGGEALPKPPATAVRIVRESTSAVVALISLLLCILKESSAMMEKKGSTVHQIVPAAGLALVWAACAKPIGFVEGASGWAPNKLPGQRSASSLRGLRSQAPESGPTQGTRPGLALGFSGLGLAAVARAGALRSRHRSAKVSRRFFGNLFGPEEEVDPEDPGRVAVCKEYQTMSGDRVAAEQSDFGWAVVSQHDASEQDAYWLGTPPGPIKQDGLGLFGNS
eukprot:s71_g7.t2